MARHKTVKASGQDVNVPDRAINKVSYFLRCATLSCGLDFIEDDLVDYKNAHYLSSDRQDAILILAFIKFNLESFTAKTIFLDCANNILPRNTSNKFYELEQARQHVEAQEYVMIEGNILKMHKIMICNRQWIHKNYVKPFHDNRSRILRVKQCKLFSTVIQQLASNDEGDNRDSDHCDHCRGRNAFCACNHGCPPNGNSACQVVHDTAICGSCYTTTIKGARYSCLECNNFDLCERCYESDDHAGGTHAFTRLARVGLNPVYIKPKKTADKLSSQQMDRSSPISSDSDTRFDADFSATIVNTVAAPTYQVGQTVRLMGLVKKSELNGTVATPW